QEDRFLVRFDDQPVSAVELALQLSRRPPGVAREEADSRGWLAEQGVDRIRKQREVDSGEHRERAARVFFGPEQSEQSLRDNRPSEEDRVGEGFEALG